MACHYTYHHNAFRVAGIPRFNVMTKSEIIEKFWPKPSKSDSVPAMKEAISKMMDEWARLHSPNIMEYISRDQCIRLIGMARKDEMPFNTSLSDEQIFNIVVDHQL